MNTATSAAGTPGQGPGRRIAGNSHRPAAHRDPARGNRLIRSTPGTYACPFLTFSSITSSFGAITDVSLAIGQLGSWGVLCHCCMSAACAARRLPARSSISGCLRSVRAMSPTSKLDDAEVFYPLHVRLCEACLLVQLPAYVSGEDIFSDYAYFSSYSDSWVAHAKRYAEAMIERLDLTSGSLVTEVASNDGYLLQHFQAAGHPGARRRAGRERGRGGAGPGHPDRGPVPGRGDRPRRSRDQYGRADLVAANNVFAHVPDIRGFAAGPARAGQGRGHGDAGVPAPAPPDRAAAVRHDLPRALLLPVPADLVRGAGDGRAARGRRGRTRHARRIAARLRPPRRERRRADRAGEGGAGRGGVRGAAHRRRATRVSRPRC